MLGPTPIYFGDSNARLFGWFHRPERATRRTAVVICNPIGDDYVRAHRALRHLAEELCAAGFGVLRFDFSGTGDSAGDERAPGRIAAWCRDVGVAIDEARAQSGAAEVALVGLRLGATIAAEVAAQRGDLASVVLWHPFVDGPRFAAETIRMHKMHRMLEPDSFAAGPTSYPDGQEALGFFLTNETIADLKTLDLMKLAKRPAPHVLVVGAGNVPAEEPTLDRLRTLDAHVAYRHLPGHKFLISIPHKAVVPQEVLDAIVGWLSETHAAIEPVATPRARGAVTTHKAATFEEEPVVIDGAHRLFGILARPPADKLRADRPAILLTNGGTVHRIGPHRMYVAMARELAALGFYVLRLDLSGIGDSAAAAGDENQCYPSAGVDDCQRAMAALTTKTAARTFILAGVCSGADIAFQAAAADRRVVGIVLMNPRTFGMHDAQMLETYRKARYYQESFFKREKWVKLLSGKVDVVRVAKMVAPKFKDVALRSVKRVLDRVRPARDGGGLGADVPTTLRQLGERGVDTLIVSAVRDPGVDFLDVHFGSGMRALATLASFKRADLAGTDNTFTSVWSQASVRTTVRDHLAQRHLT